MKAVLPKFRAKLPAKLHPRIKKIEGMLAELSKEVSDLESYTKQLWSLVDKFIQEKGGTKKNTLDLTFCESCQQEWRSQADELEQNFKNKYSEAEQKEFERKSKEIDKEGEQLFSEFAVEVGEEKAEQIDKEIDKLKKQKPKKPTNTENNKDNSKLNWAIGLGIAAVFIGLLCFFVLLIRRKNKH